MTKNGASIFLLPLFLTACLYDGVETRTRPDPPNVQSVNQYFPDSVGNYWEYSVLDNGVLSYTVSVNIVGKQRLINGLDASVWVYDYPSQFLDTLYVWTVGDTIKVTHKYRAKTIQFLNYPEEIYPIPFKDGQQWKGVFVDDTYISKSIAPNEYQIPHSYGANPETTDYDTLYFKPNVGFTVRKLSSSGGSPGQTRLFELKKYYLK